MKWMAVGEIGAVIIGLTCAIVAVVFLGNLAMPAKVTAFLVALYVVTKCALWVVHLGYDETMRPTSSRH